MKILKTVKTFLLTIAAFLTCMIYPAFTSSIQETINATVPGGKVFIRRGEYVEQIVINKSIHLTGEDLDAVIFNSNGSGDVITILGGNVLLESVSVKNSGEGFAGIYVKAENVTIINCLITNCYIGIKIDASSKIRVINCTMLNNTYAGIRVWSTCEDIEIHNSTISGSKYAVGLFTFSKRNKLFNNIIHGNYIGVALINSKENQIANNILFNNSYGLYFEDRLSTDNLVTKNNLFSNIYGVYINIFVEGRTNNLFCYNNFINNTHQVYFEPPFYSINYWNLSYPHGGNYWSDHTIEDLNSGVYQNITSPDGLVDKPYYIAKNNIDYYPLAKPYSPPVREKGGKDLLYQTVIVIAVAVTVYGLTYLLIRRRSTETRGKMRQYEFYFSSTRFRIRSKYATTIVKTIICPTHKEYKR